MDQSEYIERVYAGVLGKIIGVYLGRPFEGWTYEAIMSRLGEIKYYVHEKLDVPLIVTDDDISGTFTFLRALQDSGHYDKVSAEEIGQSWLNYLIEGKTVLWWGGMGNSTEHTAYLRLKKGIHAPQSGSCEINGKTVSEQIGAQIFIDGWAMVSPGDPCKAVDLARRAASVSHDGEAIYGAQVLAAMESLAFIENGIDKLIDDAVGFIPKDLVIFRMISDLREWHQKNVDWRKTRHLLEMNYGYDRYGGNCHMVPNHGLIHLGLLYGEDDFSKTLTITNTAGWDTDCNSGNVGCLMGIKNGLSGLEGEVDWRGPVSDRMFIPTADGGRAITDAVSESLRIVNYKNIIDKKPAIHYKNGARFHFELPGSVQGFQCAGSGNVFLKNVSKFSKEGTRSLALQFSELSDTDKACLYVPTFIQKEELSMGGYGLIASPTLYPGQLITVGLSSDPENMEDIHCRLFISAFGANDDYEYFYADPVSLSPGGYKTLDWELDFAWKLVGMPIAQAGIEFSSDHKLNGCVYLDYFTWEGDPIVINNRPSFIGSAWRKSWVNAVDDFSSSVETFRLIQNEGRGFLIHGTQDWTDYQVNADVTPHMARSSGIAARFQGLKRYYAFLLCDDGKAKLVKMCNVETILAEINQGWRFGEGANLSLRVEGNRLQAYWDGFLIFDVHDEDEPLLNGAVALVIEDGRTATEGISIFPLGKEQS